ncbi:DUF2971 domain-containing protein [Anaerosporobacter sp.]|uniref:DUF2971 domain-containing protein n=1 Tax=Anaerosporobacter sp. TaxID=1872529 RepID=UPI00286F3B05|nr:DUF2971 domain-containing protein [Anaerosporobacter sp.]
MKYLYHYTSLETLALILKNKTLCFNNLLNVDDIEEAQSQDMGKIGAFVYVSCWTEDMEESIPLWNLYTPNMHGVRIRLPVFPFVKYHYKRGEMFFGEDTETFINCKALYDENKICVSASCPLLIKVEYTNDYDKLFPKVKRESLVGDLQKFLEAKDMNNLGDIMKDNIEVSYSFEDIGNYKRENWKFQNEWRYKITIMPMGMQELNPPTLEKQQELIRRLENKNNEPPYHRLFLSLAPNVFSDMEVIFGPKMSEAEKIMGTSLLNEYAPKCVYRDSYLKIK